MENNNINDSIRNLEKEREEVRISELENDGITEFVVVEKKKLNIFVKIFLTLISIVIGLIIVAIILIRINPLFGWFIAAPWFMYQDFRSGLSDVTLEKEKEEILESDVIISQDLTYSDCRGIGNNMESRIANNSLGELDINDPRINKYSGSLNSDALIKRFGHCYTSQGEFVIQYIMLKNSSSRVEILKVNPDLSLNNIINLAYENTPDFVEDKEGSLFIEYETGVYGDRSSIFYIFNNSLNKFQKIIKADDDYIKLCLSEDYGSSGSCDIAKFKGAISGEKESNVSSDFLGIKMIIYHADDSRKKSTFGDKNFIIIEESIDSMRVRFPYKTNDEERSKENSMYMFVKKFDKTLEACSTHIEEVDNIKNINGIEVSEVAAKGSLRENKISGEMERLTYKSYFVEKDSKCFEITFEMMGGTEYNSEVKKLSEYINTIHF